LTDNENYKISKKKNNNGFKKGKSGNPLGAPVKFQSYAWFIDKYSIQSIDDINKIDLSKMPIKEAIIIKQYIEAYNENDLKVAEWLANRSEGAPKQTIEQTGNVPPAQVIINGKIISNK